MKLTIETNKGNFDIQKDNFIIRTGCQFFNNDGYYFNYCVLFIYQKNIQSKINKINKINKIIWNNDIFENVEQIGGLIHSGFSGSKKLKNIELIELIKLIDTQPFNNILSSYFKERYCEFFESIKNELISKIDLKYQIGLNVYLTLKK